MKTEEERNTLKEEVEAVNKKSAELTDEELTQVVAAGYGGIRDLPHFLSSPQATVETETGSAISPLSRQEKLTKCE